MESSRADEENVVGLDRTVFGVYNASLDDRQDVSLYALAGNVSSAGHSRTGSDLIYLVDEDYAVLLGIFHGFVRDHVHVYQLLSFLLP